MILEKGMRFWIVIDPSPVSEMYDILWSSDLDGFQNWVVGVTLGNRKSLSDMNLKIYKHKDATEARQDAVSRMTRNKEKGEN